MSDLGRAGYEAYTKSTGGKTFDGRTMPTWDELPAHISAAWAAAAEAVVAAHNQAADDNINRSMTEKFGQDWLELAKSEPDTRAAFSPEVTRAFFADDEGDYIDLGDGFAVGWFAEEPPDDQVYLVHSDARGYLCHADDGSVLWSHNANMATTMPNKRMADQAVAESGPDARAIPYSEWDT